MKLNKYKWDHYKLNEIMSFKNGFNFNKGTLENGWKVLGVSDFKDYFYPNYQNLEILVSDKLPSKDYLIEDNDILFVRSNGNKDLVGRTLLIKNPPFPITFSAFCIRGRFINPIVDSLFFTFYSKSDLFKTSMKKLVQGTNITNVSQGLLAQMVIPIPPQEEQKQIVSLFQSIETVIEQIEEKENNLLRLKKTLLNKLIADNSEWGKLDKKDWTKIKFSEVVNNLNKTEKDPLAKGLKKAVGLENINPNDLKIQNWVDIEQSGTKFSRVFKKGQYLFGARRAYLKQIALADFDGVCTANIMVFDLKNQEKMLRNYIGLIIQSDVFINHATNTSVGSLFPNAKWSAIAEFVFQLPDLKIQQKIMEVFQQIEITIKKIKTQKQTLKDLKQKLLNEILG